MPEHSSRQLVRVHRHRWLWTACILAGLAGCVIVLGGCSTLGYYSHLAVGEAHVLLAREPIDQVIANPDTSARLRTRLALALRARKFASATLKLPANKSYTTYADIGRPFVMYNVFATPALSLKPVTHCFAFAGCVAYQGFYHLQRAQALAAKLKAKGDDVYIGGVPAYSTLGHFADPILSSMNRWSTGELIGTIFHELAHQEYYVKNDTTFNESFATFVQRQGLREWRAANDLPPPNGERDHRRKQFTGLILTTRKKLTMVYAGPLSAAAKLERKHALFQQLRAHYASLVATQWGGDDVYAGWFKGPLNNAKLLPFGLYDQDTGAFARLFHTCHGNWTAFYARVRAIGNAGAARRHSFLTGVQSSDAGQRG